MIFNKGFLCPEHGPIRTAASKTRLKIKYNVCPDCSKVVTPWERPLNERPGRCSNCANGSFESELVEGKFLRECKKCKEKIDIDTGEIITQGKEEMKYGL